MNQINDDQILNKIQKNYDFFKSNFELIVKKKLQNSEIFLENVLEKTTVDGNFCETKTENLDLNYLYKIIFNFGTFFLNKEVNEYKKEVEEVKFLDEKNLFPKDTPQFDKKEFVEIDENNLDKIGDLSKMMLIQNCKLQGIKGLNRKHETLKKDLLNKILRNKNVEEDSEKNENLINSNIKFFSNKNHVGKKIKKSKRKRIDDEQILTQIKLNENIENTELEIEKPKKKNLKKNLSKKQNSLNNPVNTSQNNNFEIPNFESISPINFKKSTSSKNNYLNNFNNPITPNQFQNIPDNNKELIQKKVTIKQEKPPSGTFSNNNLNSPSQNFLNNSNTFTPNNFINPNISPINNNYLNNFKNQITPNQFQNNSDNNKELTQKQITIKQEKPPSGTFSNNLNSPSQNFLNNNK
jgi:hypothetical protein